MFNLKRLRTIFENVSKTDHRFSPPLKIAIAYIIPPIILLLSYNGIVPLWIGEAGVVSALLITAVAGVWLKGFHRNEFREGKFNLEQARAEFENDIWSVPEAGQVVDEWRLEYEQISEEIRTYNSLAVRSTYFSLATLAILGSVFFTQIQTIFQPFVAAFGIAISFAFMVIAEKNVLLRDLLRSRQQSLETVPALKGTLTSARTWNAGLKYGKFPSANLGVQLVDFNKFWVYIWITGYHVSSIYTAFFVI